MKRYWVLIIAVVVVLLIYSCSSPKEKVLVLLRESSEAMNMMIENEFKPIEKALTKAGYIVETASETRKEIGTENSRMKSQFSINSVNIKEYIGVVIPCMAAGGTNNEIPQGAIDLIITANNQGILLAAQQSGVILLGKAGILMNKKFTIVEESKDLIQGGIYQGTGVVQDGNITTSGICPYLHSETSAKDGTLEMINLFIKQLKRKVKT
jgi:transcriptional regulator GlxA family with amidase domain